MAAKPSVARLEVVRPDPPSEGEDVWEATPPSVGGDPGPWGNAFVALNRALVDPLGGHEFPAPPRPGSSHAHAIGYWAAALHLLIYRLGWLDPVVGLDQWQELGSPVEDIPTLLLRDIFLADGQLELLHGWLRTGPASTWATEIARTVGAGIPVLRAAERPDPELLERAELARTHNPLSGGSDSLHLGSHAMTAVDVDSEHDSAEMFRSSPGDRRAVLVLDTADGWAAQLAGWGAALPDISDRSWRVEVIVRPAGSLGTFRRSRRTGMWFQGRHRSHQLGW